MKSLIRHISCWAAAVFLSSCAVQNPYATTNRAYKKQVKAYATALRTTPVPTPGADSLPPGRYWVGTTNFNLRKPNYVVLHHTAQDSTGQTLKTFTLPRTEVSAHYVIGRDGRVYHLLNDYLRAWHGGVAKWGNDTDINSNSIGIELDNNGQQPFAEAQIRSLLKLLGALRKTYNIPAANFIGHSDIAPARKTDPSIFFPWKTLADHGFGLWYDASALAPPLLPDSVSGQRVALLDTVALDQQLAFRNELPILSPREALRIIGYDTQNMAAAIRAFKLHFIQQNLTAPLTEADQRILYNLYKKYL